MKMNFKVGAICFEISFLYPIKIPEHFKLFQNNDCVPDYYYVIEQVEQLPEPVGIQKSKRIDFAVYEEAALEERYIGIKNLDSYYAYYQEVDETHAKIKVMKGFEGDLRLDIFFTSLFALERRCIAKDEIVLHTAYIEYHGKAILFSAPSETGKTTQADLWEKYRGAKTINGDRGLLFKKDGVWYAGGWPVCGSSEICENISMPVHAIVMLSQAKENIVEKLEGMKAFSPVYSQITINRWNNEAHLKAMNLIETLVSEVPVYHLACDISEDAVICLENQLFAEA